MGFGACACKEGCWGSFTSLGDGPIVEELREVIGDVVALTPLTSSRFLLKKNSRHFGNRSRTVGRFLGFLALKAVGGPPGFPSRP